jgi:opacity protein-like surface antigen
MRNIFILITVFFLSLTGMASAQWYGEIRGIVPFDSDGTYEDKTTGDDRITSAKFNTDEEAHYGVGIGYALQNNFSIGLNYEKNDTRRLGSSATGADGTQYDYLQDNLDITTLMLELAYNYSINDQFDLIGLVGVGRSELETSGNVDFKIAGQAAAVATEGSGRDVNDTASRIGFGGEFKATDQISIVGTVMRTDYGTAERSTESGTDDVFSDVEEDSFLIGLRYKF